MYHILSTWGWLYIHICLLTSIISLEVVHVGDQASFSKRPCTWDQFEAVHRSTGLWVVEQDPWLAAWNWPSSRACARSQWAWSKHLGRKTACVSFHCNTISMVSPSLSFPQIFPLVVVFALACFGLQRLLYPWGYWLGTSSALVEDPPSPANLWHDVTCFEHVSLRNLGAEENHDSPLLGSCPWYPRAATLWRRSWSVWSSDHPRTLFWSKRNADRNVHSYHIWPSRWFQCPNDFSIQIDYQGGNVLH